MLTYSREAARRRRARARGLRGAGAARPRRRAVRARAAPARRSSAPTARAGAASSATSRSTRRSTSASWAMLAAYTDGLRPLLADGGFDIVHAQDCLSANAALDAARRRASIDHVIRTVHHVDDFTLALAGRVPGALDRRPRPRAVRLGAVGRAARATSSACDAGLVANGVDARRFRPPRDARRARRDARRRAALDDRLAVLTVGGIEPRKGSLTLLEGFARAARARARSATRCC